MRKNKKKRNLMLLLILILMVSVGYALLSTTLNINGTTKVKNAKWDIHWENPEVITGSASSVVPTIDSLKTTATFDVTLTTPGDYYAFTIDAVNKGTIDGEISEIKKLYNDAEISATNKLPVYIDYVVTDENDEEIEVGQRLNVNDTKKYKVMVTYKKDIENSELPGQEVTISLKYQVTYVQASSSAQGNNDDEGKVTLTNPTVLTTDGDTTYLDPTWISANPIYYNPTTASVCSQTEYEANTVDVLSNSGCMKWYAYSTKNGKSKLLLDHNLYLGEYDKGDGMVDWMSSSDAAIVIGGGSTTGITFTQERNSVFEGNNYYGPQTALKVLGLLTSNWQTQTYSEVYHQVYNHTMPSYVDFSRTEPEEITIDYSSYKAIFITQPELYKFNAANVPSFFYDNLVKDEEWYWTASPDYFDDNDDYKAFIIGNSFFSENAVNAGGGIRPVIIVPSEIITE